MLRILHAIRSVNPAIGGPLEGVLQISKINTGFGHKPEILSLDAPDDPWVSKQPYPVHAMGPAITSYGYCPRLTKWLRAHRKNYDVVVINGIWAYNAFGVWRAIAGTDTPYFVYTHGMLDPWFKYRYPWKHAKKWLFWPWSVFPVLRDASGVMFTCNEERLLARKSFWLYDCNEIVVDYGTPGVPDPSKDYAASFLEKHPHLKPYRRFVFLGRVHPKKAPDIILRTLARLKAEGIWDSGKMRLIMAGPSDGDYATILQALARKLGLAESVVWTGMLLGDDKWGALQCAEAFLLPSHQENFGIAVAESLSVGVPVLISRSVNIWREIVADRAGLADEDTDEGCYRQWSEWLGYSLEQRSAMGENARACFSHRYTALNAARSLLANIYLMEYHKKSLTGSALRVSKPEEALTNVA
jgi:glycosyltransferase involved in cell wall biosynthesis